MTDRRTSGTLKEEGRRVHTDVYKIGPSVTTIRHSPSPTLSVGTTFPHTGLQSTLGSVTGRW